MQCAICLESNNQSSFIKQYNCIHQFHESCLSNWNSTCPLCRANRINLNGYFKENCYGFTVTPKKYINSFYENCKNNNHLIKISKPYGVLLECQTCGMSKSYNWMH